MDGEMVRPSVVTLFLALVNARMFQGIQTSLTFESTQLEVQSLHMVRTACSVIH